MGVAINKTESFVLAQIPIFLCYMTPFYFFVASNNYVLQLLLAFYFAVLFLFTVKIETGTRAELIFFDKATGVYWEDGLCVLPTLFPFLHHVNVHLFWWIKRQNRNHQAFSDTKPDITHHFDSTKMQYSARISTNMLAANVNRTFDGTKDFFTEYKRGDPELLFQRAGFRMMIVIIVIGFFTNQFSPSRVSDRGPSVAQNQNTDNTVLVTIQLMKRDRPIYPSKELFVPQSEDGKRFEIIRGRKYYYYKDEGVNIPAMLVTDSRCAAIPAGRKMFFLGRLVPTYAVNMKEEVTYNVTSQSMPIHKKFAKAVLMNEPFDSPFYLVDRPWETMYDEWSSAVVTSKSFLAEAKSLDEIRPGTYGGLVCF